MSRDLNDLKALCGLIKYLVECPHCKAKLNQDIDERQFYNLCTPSDYGCCYGEKTNKLVANVGYGNKYAAMCDRCFNVLMDKRASLKTLALEKLPQDQAARIITFLDNANVDHWQDRNY